MPSEPIQRQENRESAPIVRASLADREDQPDRDPGSAWFRQVRERFRRAKEFERERRGIFETCVQNVAGVQWTTQELKNRINRPNPVINMLAQHCNIVLNDMRMNRPGPKVSPKDGGDESKETAEIIEGMLRDIEYSGHGDVAYDTADKYQVIGGFGYYGATVDFVAPDSRKQELRVRRFPDPTCVYMDCESVEPDGSDAKWYFVRKKFTKDQWAAKFGNSRKDKQAFYAANNFFEKDDAGWQEFGEWIDEGGKHVYLAEYWEIVEEDRILVGLKDGTDDWEDEVDDRDQIDITVEPITKKWPKVTNYLIDGADIYDETEWKGRYIPIVPEFADEIMVDGKRSFFPLPIFALDSQQAINYVAALWIEAMSLIPKGKWHGPVGSFASKNKDWQHANTSTVSYLEWDAKVGPNGQVLPPPSFQQPTVDGQGYAIQLQFWQSALMAAIGQHEPSLGSTDPEERSGKAIDLLQKQGSLATSSFSNNSIRSRLHFYRILIDLIPKVYTGPQIVRTIGADDKEALVWINKEFSDKAGKAKIHDIENAVRMEAIVDVGQQYHDLRQKAFDYSMEIMKADPQLWNRIGYLAIKLADLGPLGDQMSDLLIPPDVKAQQQSGMDPQTAKLAQQLQQATGEIHRLSEFIEKKKAEEGAKFDRERYSVDTKAREGELERQNKLLIALIGAKSSDSQALAELALKRDDMVLGYNHEDIQGNKDKAHELAMSAVTHQQGLEQGQQQADNAAQSQQSDQAFQQQQQESQPQGDNQ